MKRLIFLFFFGLCVAHTSTAQVKIGDNPQNIDASSVLELESTDKVLVITRVTTAQMNAISPLQGAMVYNTDVQGVHYYDGTQWVNIGGGGGTGGPLTADAIVNAGGEPTIVITPTATGDNLEVAPNSISTAQIAPFGINGTTDIQPESIGVGKFAEDAITEYELSENSVGPEQIQNQNIDLGDFNNVAGFITAADVVSADAGNVIESRADGVYYNDDQLIMDIADTDQKIDDHITDDLDTSLANEIQNLSLSGNTLTLSKPIGADDVITLPSSSGEIDDNELITGAVLTGTDLIITEAGTNFTVPLASLSGGGGATVINSTATVTVMGTGTTGDPYELTAVGGGGGGTTEVADQTTITGLGTAGNPFTIEPGGTGQFLSTDAAGDVVWATAGPGGGGTTEEVDGILLTGTGTTASPFTINPGAADQILRTNAAGDAVAWVPLPTGAAAITDTTIDGDGSSVATALGLADEAVTIEKIAPGAADQILRTNAAGDAVAWVPLPTGAAAITDATIDGDGSSVATALGLADAAVTLEKIAPNGATANGDIIQWNTDLDGPGPLTDAGWEVVANTASTTLTDGNIFVGDALNAPQGVVLSGDATIDNLGELTVAPEAIELTMLNQNGATADGDIMQWNTDLDGAGPLTDAGWEVVANAGHTGEAKSIFFADTDGTPTQFFHPVTDRPSFYWDPNGRNFPSNSFGALAIGVDGDPQGGVLPELSNEVKVHIAEKLPASISYSLLLHNSWDTGGPTTGSGVGMLFASDRYNDGKGALIFERRDNWGVGDFHFLQNNEALQKAPVLATDKAFTITRDKNIILYGDLFDKNDDFITPTPLGHVLTNTINGTEWAPAGGLPTATTDGQILTWDADATPTAGGYIATAPQAIALDVANNEIDIAQTIGATTTVTSSIKLDNLTLEAANNGTDDVVRIKPAPGAVPLAEDQILVTDRLTGVVNWEDTPDASEILLNPALNVDNDNLTPDETTVQGAISALMTVSGGQNLFSTNGLILAANRTHNLNGNNLILGGASGGQIGIGDFGGSGPASVRSKFDVDGQITASNGFAATAGTEGNPGYGFFTSGDIDTGMFRAGENRLGFSTDGIERVEINASGEVGIGVATPNEQLDVQGRIRSRTGFNTVNGSEAIPGYNFYEEGGTGMFAAAVDILGFSAGGSEGMRVLANGNVGIGLISPLEGLHVAGNIRADGNFISNNTTIQIPDYVFQKYFMGSSDLNENYNFQTLAQIEAFVKKYHHLPGIKSAKKVKEDDIWNLSESNLQNLEKIEELFLHTIEQEHKIKKLESDNQTLVEELKAMQKDLKEIKALLKNK